MYFCFLPRGMSPFDIDSSMGRRGGRQSSGLIPSKFPWKLNGRKYFQEVGRELWRKVHHFSAEASITSWKIIPPLLQRHLVLWNCMEIAARNHRDIFFSWKPPLRCPILLSCPALLTSHSVGVDAFIIVPMLPYVRGYGFGSKGEGTHSSVGCAYNLSTILLLFVSSKHLKLTIVPVPAQHLLTFVPVQL